MRVLDADPDWAWAPFEPSREHPWDRRLAAHLYRRAGFGASLDFIDAAVDAGPSAAIGAIVDAEEPSEFSADMARLAEANLATGNAQNLAAWWLYRMMATPAPLRERMTLFWHGHFATSAEKVGDARLMYRQNNLLREQALGDFSILLQEISRDPAMLIYLDSDSNRKSHPNENYAREIMELFALGEGQYSEQDIRELARCFTGWEIRRGKFRFNRYQHDTGEKSILGKTGTFGGEEGVEIVLAQRAAPRFLASKLIREFICDEPAPSPPLIEPLAQILRESNLQLEPVVRSILSSNLFFSARSVGRKVRSPVDLAVGLLRSLDATTNTYLVAESLRKVGQGLFYPPNVKGWDGGRTWINSSTLLGRANLMRDLLTSDKTRFAGSSLEELIDSQGLATASAVVDWWQQHLVAVPLTSDVTGRVMEILGGARGTREERLRSALLVLCTLPEFQLG